MKIHITAKQLELTPSIKAHVDKKVGSLSRVLGSLDGGDRVVSAIVEIGRTTKHHRHGEIFSASIIIRLGKKIIRANADSGDMRAAVSEAKEKMEGEIKKYKTRMARS